MTKVTRQKARETLGDKLAWSALFSAVAYRGTNRFIRDYSRGGGAEGGGKAKLLKAILFHQDVLKLFQDLLQFAYPFKYICTNDTVNNYLESQKVRVFILTKNVAYILLFKNIGKIWF